MSSPLEKVAGTAAIESIELLRGPTGVTGLAVSAGNECMLLKTCNVHLDSDAYYSLHLRHCRTGQLVWSWQTLTEIEDFTCEFVVKILSTM